MFNTSLTGKIFNKAQFNNGYIGLPQTSNMNNIEALAHIVDLSSRTIDTATYEYIMREAQETMRDKKTEDILYCDLAALVSERLKNQALRARQRGFISSDNGGCLQ